MFRTALFILLTMLIAFTGAASAQPPGPIDPNASRWWMRGPCATMMVSNCPAGDFELVSAGCGSAGTASIEYQLIDVNGNPVLYLPTTDIWFRAASPSEVLFFKPNMPVTDAPTDLTGWTRTTIRLCAGGCATLGLQCLVLDPVTGGVVILQNPPVINTIIFKSPDLNADGVVNLSDLGIFGTAYTPLPYNPCCDYNDDGIVNLSDLASFGVHYTHQ